MNIYINNLFFFIGVDRWSGFSKCVPIFCIVIIQVKDILAKNIAAQVFFAPDFKQREQLFLSANEVTVKIDVTHPVAIAFRYCNGDIEPFTFLGDLGFSYRCLNIAMVVIKSGNSGSILFKDFKFQYS